MKTPKHGIEIRFNKSRKLKILSYAVWLNGSATVSHATTAHNRRVHGSNLQVHIQIERAAYPELQVI